MEMRQLRAIEERVRNPVSTPDGGIYKVTQSPYHTTRSKQVQTLRKLMVVNSARISCPVLNCVCCKNKEREKLKDTRHAIETIHAVIGSEPISLIHYIEAVFLPKYEHIYSDHFTHRLKDNETPILGFIGIAFLLDC